MNNLNSLALEIPYILLPKTADPLAIQPNDADWIRKPAFGRVGEGIAIKGAVSEGKSQAIEDESYKTPQDWVAQRMFHSLEIDADDGTRHHLCIGVFTVQGRFAGFYGRINPYPHIDANAREVPILINKF